MLHASHENFLCKAEANKHEFIAFEKLLGKSIRPFLSELYMVSPGTMIAYICADQNANIEDIVASSTEALGRPGSLRYGKVATVDFDWGEAPAVTIRMEFLHDTLTAFFDLIFQRGFVGVDILGILYKDTIGSAAENLQRFAEATAEVRAKAA